MPERVLPTELVSLIHHIELNKVGWWDVVVQRLVLACIWLTGKPLTVANILEKAQDLDVDLRRGKVESQVGQLAQAGVLLSLEGDRFKISEEAHRELEGEMQEAQQVEQRAREKFLEIVRGRCPSLNAQEAWVALNDQLLLPAVKQMGCRFYSLIAEQDIKIDSLPTLEALLSGYSPEVSSELQAAVTTYLCSGDRHVRSYILRYLSAYFFVEAGKLSDQMIRSLIRLMEKPPTFKIFADTNFIFSVLGLRPNPSNEAAQTALELASQLSEAVDVKFHVLPITLKETRAAIQLRLDDLKGVCLTPHLARATLRHPGASGFVRRLAEEVDKVGQSLTAQDLFEPYANNLVPIARSHGIELYEVDLSEYGTDDRVIDDLNVQLEREEKRHGDDAKGYAQLRHDIILWHFVHDLRPGFIESPTQAESWVVTVDYRFLGYDAFKIRVLGEQIPVSLHPTALIQLLQFWLPRTAKLEDTLYSSWLWPLLFPAFDVEAEEVTIRIVRSLSRFENIDDLPAPAVDRILLNTALRQRISSEEETEAQIEMVREALITEAKRASLESEVQQQRAEEAGQEVANLTQELKRQRQTSKGQAEALTDAHRLTRETESKLQNRIGELEGQLEMNRFLAVWVMPLLLLSFSLGTGVAYGCSRYFGWRFWESATLAWASLLLVAVWLVHRRGKSNEGVADSRWFQQFTRLKNWLFAGLGMILVGLIVEMLGAAIIPRLRRLFSGSS